MSKPTTVFLVTVLILLADLLSMRLTIFELQEFDRRFWTMLSMQVLIAVGLIFLLGVLARKKFFNQ